MALRHRIAIGLAAGAGLAWGARAWIRSQRRIELAGRVVVVTGSSSGLGLIVARQAAKAGASLVIAARDSENLQAAADDLRRFRSDVLAVPTDVSDPEQASALIEQAIERFGRVDILINNAGIMRVGPVEAMNLDDFREAMETNFWGELYPTLAVLPHMKASGGGRIGNVVSVGGRIAFPHLLPYTASKYALTGLTEGLRAELAKDNILVTGIYPGTIRTGGHAHAMFKGDQEAEYTWFALSDIIPGIAASAEGAARSLWDAVQHGDPEVIVGWNARLAILGHHLFPSWTAEIAALVNQALPGPRNTSGPAVRGEQLVGSVPETLSRWIPPGTRPEAGG